MTYTQVNHFRPDRNSFFLWGDDLYTERLTRKYTQYLEL